MCEESFYLFIFIVRVVFLIDIDTYYIESTLVFLRILVEKSYIFKLLKKVVL